MPWTLTTIAPDGVQTVHDSVTRPGEAAAAVAEFLTRTAPWMTRREHDRIALQLSRNPGKTYIDLATGYRLRIDTTEEN